MNDKNSAEKIFDSFTKLKALIIGDVMIDSYLWGDVSRISPEAPVPIVSVEKRENRLGGAANVAKNIKSLGATPILCSVIGQDDKSSLFFDLMDREGLDKAGIVKSPHRLTTTKFRIIGNNHQMLRVDEESLISLQNEEMTSLMKFIKNILKNKKVDVVIFEDYDKGAISHELILSVINLANNNNIPVVVDPKKNNFLYYRNATLFKPNLKELEEGLKTEIDIDNQEQIEKALRNLLDKIQADTALLTLSDRGIFVCSKINNSDEYLCHKIPAHIRDVADVSGAGDTVVSVAALCTALGMSPKMLASFSNLAGGLVCEEVGVVPINKDKFMKETIKMLG